MSVTLLAAVASNGVIGVDNKLPWDFIADDMKNFRETTLDNIVVMGSNTFDSLGKRPLPNRTNVVFTSDPTKYSGVPGIIVVKDMGEFLSRFDLLRDSLFIIGGSSIYELFLPKADTMLITEIDRKYEGDVKFPEFNKGNWDKEILTTKNQNGLFFRFVQYIRK